MKTFNWGIAGLGNIAEQFAESIQNTQQNLLACVSRSQEKAEMFASRHSIQKVYSDYTVFLSDEAIDIVYVAVPNQQHFDYIMAALNAGKHVLCEKAITLNSKQLTEAMELAQQKELILAEAMTIFNMPLYHELRSLIDTGKLGKLKMIHAPFGSYKEPDPRNRFFNPDLGGGALLDIGTYAVSFARWFFSQQPQVISSVMIPFQTGVDEQSVTILQNKNELASVDLSFQAKMPKQGIVSFENGYLTIDDYPRADQARIYFNDGTTELIVSGESSNALVYEIQQMVSVVSGEKANQSLFFTKDVIDLLDQMQQTWQKNLAQ